LGARGARETLLAKPERGEELSDDISRRRTIHASEKEHFSWVEFTAQNPMRKGGHSRRKGTIALQELQLGVGYKCDALIFP